MYKLCVRCPRFESPFLKYIKRGGEHRQESFVQSPRFESSSLKCNLCLNLIGAPNANQLRNCTQVLFLNQKKGRLPFELDFICK